MKYMTWREYFRSREFYILLMEDIEKHAPKIKATWSSDVESNQRKKKNL